MTLEYATIDKAAGKPLRLRTFHGFMWLFTGKGYTQLLFLVNAVVLGRLLSPHDFGLVGLGNLAIYLFSVVTTTGFAEALIQKPHLTHRVVHTAWWVMVGRTALVAITLFAAAPLIAAWFREPTAVPILRTLAGIYLLSGFTSIGNILLHKDLAFDKLFKFDALGQTFDLLTAISVALVWRNVWALVAGTFAGTVSRVLYSYLLHPIRPQFIFDIKAAKELFGFGIWLLFTGLFHFLVTRGTDVMSGFIFGATALGLYQMASRFALLPSNHIGDIFMQALFPSYSLAHAEPERLRTMFLKVLQVVIALVFPLSTLMIVVVGPSLPVILSPKWQGVVGLVPGLAIGGAVQALLRTAQPLVMAAGKPKYTFCLSVVTTLGIVLCIYPLSHFFGLAGLAWSYGLGISFGLPLWWRFVRQESGAGSLDLLTALLPPVLACLLMAGIVWLPVQIFSIPLYRWSSLTALALLGIVGTILYGGLIMIAQRLFPGYQPVKATLGLVKETLKK